jgi:hypothetical protein
MWMNNKNHIENEKLDRFGEELLHAMEPSEAEINMAAASPFLYRRIRVRIEAEQKRLTEERGRWFTFFVEAKHAIPVLAMIAIIAVGLLWYTPRPTTQSNASPAVVEIIPLSNDEMMTSIIGWNVSAIDQQKERQ